MTEWLDRLQYDPIAPLLSSGGEVLRWHVARDFLRERAEPARHVWAQPEVTKLLRRQEADGSFKWSGKRLDVYPDHHYPLLETWKQFRYLIDQYAMSKRHPACERAAEFLFGCQTEAGDIRGMIGNQYATYYTGAILGLLIKAGYGKDPRVTRGFEWLLTMRQDDGGWTIPILTGEFGRDDVHRLTAEYTEPFEPVRSRPFSHNWTGMVLRAFAAHPRRRRSKPARVAAELLKTRFFEPDRYGSYKSADYWVRFQYPFWWNHLVAALDSLSRICVEDDDPDIARGLAWLIAKQQPSGLWRCTYERKKKYSPSPKTRESELWITLAICRILQRYYG